MLLADDKIWDQNGFNDIIRRQLGPPVDEDSGLVYAYDGELKLGLLPASIFCSGHTYFVQVAWFLYLISNQMLNSRTSQFSAIKRKGEKKKTRSVKVL